MHIAAVALSHARPPVEIRERLSTPSRLEDSLQQLRVDAQVAEASILRNLPTGWRSYTLAAAVQSRGSTAGGVPSQAAISGPRFRRTHPHAVSSTATPREAVSHLMRVGFRARQPGAGGGQDLFPGQKDGAARPGAWARLADPRTACSPRPSAPASGCAPKPTWAPGARPRSARRRGAGPAKVGQGPGLDELVSLDAGTGWRVGAGPDARLCFSYCSRRAARGGGGPWSSQPQPLSAPKPWRRFPGSCGAKCRPLSGSRPTA